jgi:hypothetical protein
MKPVGGRWASRARQTSPFCGAAPFKRYPYCLAHCLIAYRPDGESEPRREVVPARLDRGMERAA